MGQQTVCAGGSHTPPAVKSFIALCMTDGNEGRVTDSYGSTEFPGIASNGEERPSPEPLESLWEPSNHFYHF
jgi:hypothetical protein